MTSKNKEDIADAEIQQPEPDQAFAIEIKGRVSIEIESDTVISNHEVDSDVAELQTASIYQYRIAGFRLIETISMVLSLISRVRQGLPGSVIREIAEYIPRKIIIEALGSDSSNLNKLYKRNLSKTETDVVEDLTSLWAELRAFFHGDDEMLKQWISTPLPILDGEQPDSLMDTIGGRNRIRQLLNKMRYGDF